MHPLSFESKLHHLNFSYETLNEASAIRVCVVDIWVQVAPFVNARVYVVDINIIP
jgi:hypothetical protein